MIHWLQSPKSSKVSQYIECYWLIEKDIHTKSYSFPKLNPDPSAHLILAPDEQAYQYDIDDRSECGKGCHWIYPHHKTFQLDHSEPFVCLGVKFRVGALYTINIPDYEHPTLDRVKAVNLSRLLYGCEIDLSGMIELARTDTEKCCDRLDALFLPWLEDAKQDRHSQLTNKALNILNMTPIAELSDQLFCSQRTLERSFSKVTGFTLKQCQSINKLESMLEYLYQRDVKEIDWVEVAFKFGFSDQPHLIRYLKNQLGLTPNTYAKERGLTIDVYGGVNSI